MLVHSELRAARRRRVERQKSLPGALEREATELQRSLSSLQTRLSEIRARNHSRERKVRMLGAGLAFAALFVALALAFAGY